MKQLIIVALYFSIVGCVTQKNAYRIVAEDEHVDSKEATIIRQKSLALFPNLLDTPRITSSYIDSASYNATIDAYLEIIDSLSSHFERHSDEFAFIDTNDVVPANVVYRVSKLDSLRIIRKFLKTFRPPAVREVIVKEVPTADGRRDDELRKQLIGKDAEIAKANREKEDAQAKLQKKKSNQGWWIAGGIGAILIAAIGGFLASKFNLI